jgi:hypothetical protein
MITDPSEQNLQSMSLTKNKRDEFLVEIRKKKSQMILLKKRIKMFGSPNDQQSTTMQEEIFGYANQESQNTNDEPLELPEKIKAKLKGEHEKFYACLNQGNSDGLIEVIQFLREWISSKTDPLPGRVVNDMEMISPLLNLLSDDFSEKKLLQTEVAWLLANVSAGTSKDTQVLVEMNIIPVMARALGSTVNDDLHENIMWTLANISGENTLLYRDQILEQGILNMIVKELGRTPKKIVYYRIAAWLISNLVRGEPFPSYTKVEKTFGALTHLIEYPDEAIQQYTLLSLTYLSEEAKETHIKSISENSLVTKIVQSISSKDEKIAINAVKVAGNLAKGNKRLIHNLCDYEIFKALPKVLENPNPALRRNACIMLSNILSNEFDDHDYIDDYGGLESLIKLAALDDEIDIRAQATFCLQKYMDSATNEYAMIAIEKGAVEAFLKNLEETDVKLIENSLRAFYKALEHGENMKDKNGGINFITSKIMENGLHQLVEKLQLHPSEDIALQAELLYSKFFQKDLEF